MFRLVRWWVALLGGALLGAGLVLHGQIAVAEHMREEVEGTFFLWRAIGQITFVFHDDLTKTALWLHEMPDRVLVESDRAAWTLVVIGSLIALSAPLIRKRRKKPKKRASGAA